MAFEAIDTLMKKEKTRPTAPEVRELLPKGLDMLDPNEVRKYNKLIAMGESAAPALIELLQDDKQAPDVVCASIGILTILPGDKEAASAAVRKATERYREMADYDGVTVKLAALSFLERSGNADDLDILWLYVDDREETVCLKAISAIGTIGRARDIERLQDYAGKRSRDLQPDEIQHDFPLNKAHEAIERLKKKIEGESATRAARGSG